MLPHGHGHYNFSHMRTHTHVCVCVFVSNFVLHRLNKPRFHRSDLWAPPLSWLGLLRANLKRQQQIESWLTSILGGHLLECWLNQDKHRSINMLHHQSSQFPSPNHTTPNIGAQKQTNFIHLKTLSFRCGKNRYSFCLNTGNLQDLEVDQHFPCPWEGVLICQRGSNPHRVGLIAKLVYTFNH